jgi:hypothetical protein
MKIIITHVHKYDLWLLGVWPLTKRKTLRCGSRATYERTIMKLSKLLQRGRGEGGEGSADQGQFVGANMPALTIFSAPYQATPTAPQQRRRGTTDIVELE